MIDLLFVYKKLILNVKKLELVLFNYFTFWMVKITGVSKSTITLKEIFTNWHFLKLFQPKSKFINQQEKKIMNYF